MQKQNKKDIIDVIVPFFVPPFLGGTETVIRSWGDNFSSTDMFEVRLVNVFGYKDTDFLDTVQSSSNVLYSGFFNNKTFVKNFGLLFLIWHYMFTDAKSIVVLSPKYIKLAYFIRKVFKKKYKIISWIHFSLSSMFIENKKDFLLADYNLAISSGIAKQLENYGVKHDKISIIFNPVAPKKGIITPSKYPRFVYVGRIELKHQKNLLEMLQGFKQFAEMHSDAMLEIWGDGEDKVKVENTIRDMGLQKSVILHGWSSDPWKKIDAATAMLLSSTFEGLPMSILESISRGLPVISSNIETGPADEINDENGRLYSSGNINELAENMKYIYENPESYKRSKVKNTINDFYTNTYYKNLVEILKKEI